MISKQDEWKKIPLRMPPEQHEETSEYAKDNNLSINSAILELADIGLQVVGRGKPESNIKILRLPSGVKRTVTGKLVSQFGIDYANENVAELKQDVERCVQIMSKSPKVKDRYMFFNKNILVYAGSNHIDIVDDGKGTLNWLTIEDERW